jgi:hypothetical protein
MFNGKNARITGEIVPTFNMPLNPDTMKGPSAQGMSSRKKGFSLFHLAGDRTPFGYSFGLCVILLHKSREGLDHGRA